MTLLAAFQGKGHALFASDLQIRFSFENQSHLPEKQRAYQTAISEKIREIRNGDYLAFHGRLSFSEMALIHSKSKDDLVKFPLKGQFEINDSKLALILISPRENQIFYTPSITQNLRQLHPGQAFAVTDDPNIPLEIINDTQVLTRGKNLDDVFLLRKILAKWERHFLDAEKNDNVGGFAGYSISRGKMAKILENVGKLRGYETIEIVPTQ